MDHHHIGNNDGAVKDGGNSSNDKATNTTAIMMVIGMNRPRLTKIMDLMHNNNNYNDDVEYVPCLAQMSSYEAKDEGGLTRTVRYLAQLVHLDGSSLTKFLDDDEFRSSLQKVALVGYEWQQHSRNDDIDNDDDTDVTQVQRFFEANQLTVSVECVQPNVEFDTLQDEMKFFKNLGEDVKARNLVNRTMGPGKMVQFIVDMTRSILEGDDDDQTRNNQIKNEKPKDFGESRNTFEDDNGNGAETNAEIPQEPLQALSIDRIDPDLSSFACRICRTKLFGEKHLASDHVPNLHTFKRSQHGATSHHAATASTATCQSIFCDESVLEWLGEHGNSVEGRLVCPKCSAKLGHWNWSGAQCSCGTWVVPAIQIPLSKVDVIRPETTTTTTTNTAPFHVVHSPLQGEVERGAAFAKEATTGIAI